MAENKSFRQEIGEMKQFVDFISEDIENVKRVIGAVEEADIDAEFMVHAKSETVAESAENTDVDERDIVKTLVFISDGPVAFLCPGDKRVSEDKIEEITGRKARMADPGEVEEATGYVIGGVSPFDLDIPVYMEEELLHRDKVKPAAGSRVVGISLDPSKLKDLADAEAEDIAE